MVRFASDCSTAMGGRVIGWARSSTTGHTASSCGEARGGFDPKEHRFLRHMVDAYLDFRVAYTHVVVISTDNQIEINEFRDSVGAQFPFLADPKRTVQKDLKT
jgi:AhpC/TSA family